MLTKYLTKENLLTWEALVGEAQSIAIIGHVSPDGDAMGSTLALANYLKNQGKLVSVIMPNAYPDFLAWLPGATEVINFERNRQQAREVLTQANLICCLDFNGWGRLEAMSAIVSKLRKHVVLIDHHLAPEPIANLTISDPKASSTCEILFSILMQLSGLESISVEAATCIYCGMMTDTGGFTYNSNRSNIFYILSLLLTKGFDKDKIYRLVYNNYSVNRLRLEGYILHDKMQYFEDLHASVFCLTRDEMKHFQFKKGDAEGFVNLPLQIKGTKLSISLREDTEKPLIRVSLRSVDNFPCNRMAADFFNGGGHLNASGGSLPMTIEQAMAHTLKALEAYRPLLEANNVIKD